MFESRCGICCSQCERKDEVGCTGCSSMKLTFWGEECGVKSCCEKKGLDHCGECADFPCDLCATMGKEMGFDPQPRLEKCGQWRDESAYISPCGARCAKYSCYAECGGCDKVKGKVFWLQYTGGDVCGIVRCLSEKGKSSCAGCEKLPCEIHMLKDPTLTDEQNEAGLREKLSNLKNIK